MTYFYAPISTIVFGVLSPVYTIQPVVKHVVYNRFSCKRGIITAHNLPPEKRSPTMGYRLALFA